MLQALFGRRPDRTSFDREAMPHLDALYAYGLHLTRQREDAEDLLQETYVKALKSWHRYEAGTNCRAWLFRIMTNTFYNTARARKRRPQVETDALPEVELQLAEAASDNGMYRPVEEIVLDSMMSRHMQEALDSLPDDFRTVLLLADLHDFSYKEIADVCDCPVGTVMSRLHRARKAMQRKLFDHAVREGVIAAPPAAAAEAEPDAPVVEMNAWRRRASGSRG